MTAHDHREYVAGCYRCELSRDELSPLEWVEECGMVGCAYVARGVSARQTAARLTAHWTHAAGHDSHIHAVIESADLSEGNTT